MTSQAYSILFATDVTDARAGDWMVDWARAGVDSHLFVPDMPALQDLDWWARAIAQRAARLAPPVFLVARGLACHAPARWPTGERATWAGPIGGAMLVAPAAQADGGQRPLPFRSVVVASRSDPNLHFDEASSLARSWGSHCVNGGDIGSAHAQQVLGAWEYGRHVLNWLIGMAIDDKEPANLRDRAANVVRLASSRAAGAQPN